MEKKENFWNPYRIITSIATPVIWVIIGLSIEKSIENTQWFKNLVGIMGLIIHNILYIFIFLAIMTIIILLLYWKIKDFNEKQKQFYSDVEWTKKNINNLIDNLNLSNQHWFDTITKLESKIIEHSTYLFKVNSLAIKYVSLASTHNHLSDDEFVKLLMDNGFSKENLPEIGLSVEFIKAHKEKFLPNKVMDKYKEFKKELYKYHLEITENNKKADEKPA